MAERGRTDRDATSRAAVCPVRGDTGWGQRGCRGWSWRAVSSRGWTAGRWSRSGDLTSSTARSPSMMVRTGSMAGSGARTPPRRTIRCASRAPSGARCASRERRSFACPKAPHWLVQSLTAEAVVRASGSPGQWRYVLSRGSQGCTAGAYGLYTGAAGGLALYVFDGTRYVVSATARPQDVWNGSWHHVAGSFDGRALRLRGRPPSR